MKDRFGAQALAAAHFLRWPACWISTWMFWLGGDFTVTPWGFKGFGQACFVLGLSTRKVGRALLSILGEPISPSAVSRIAQALDQAVAAFHKRPMKDGYRVLLLDGVVLARKTGAGAIRRPILVALGLREDGRKEILDFRLVPGESTQAWETFLTDLSRRGLSGSRLQLICADGGQGLQGALALVYPNIPVQLWRLCQMRLLWDQAVITRKEARRYGRDRCPTSNIG
jgi:transposase-like protein